MMVVMMVVVVQVVMGMMKDVVKQERRPWDACRPVDNSGDE